MSDARTEKKPKTAHIQTDGVEPRAPLTDVSEGSGWTTPAEKTEAVHTPPKH